MAAINRLSPKKNSARLAEPKKRNKKQERSAKNPGLEQAALGLKCREPRQLTKIAIDCVLYLIRIIMAVYAWVTWPIYYFMQGVGERRRAAGHLQGTQIEPRSSSSPWHRVGIESDQLEIERQIDAHDSYDAMMKSSFAANAQLPAYGYRQLRDETYARQPSERLTRQVRQSDYKWITYELFERQIEAARIGFLRAAGVRAGQRVILYADTRPEWQVCSQSLSRLGATVCTITSMSGAAQITHIVNETKAALIITQASKLRLLVGLASKLPSLKKVIYFEPGLCMPLALGGVNSKHEQTFYEACERAALGPRDIVSRYGAGSAGIDDTVAATGLTFECLNFCAIIKKGLEASACDVRELELENARALERIGGTNKNSIAVIMYTSGSTGTPKGVLISHGNLMAAVKSFSHSLRDTLREHESHTWAAYLPLAHIFEFCVESTVLYRGGRMGFASPQTLTAKSPGLAPGETSDLCALKPSVMIMVPLLVDRIARDIKQALEGSRSYFKRRLLSYLIEYKIYWQQQHFETLLADKLVRAALAGTLGGRLQYVLCGSAPLSTRTQSFVRAALNLKLAQVYGTTETCASTTLQLFDDHTTANVGPPVSGARIKLEPWIEGDYRPDDKPNPRGEIVVGGQMISHGYYNLEDATREAFYVDAAGVRWFRTGDIGEMLPSGQLRIIDRKKDLVKLANGEYISLGRVESALRSNPYTNNLCVHVSSYHNRVAVLGPANEKSVRHLARQIVDELSPESMPGRAPESEKPRAQMDQPTPSMCRDPPLSSHARQLALSELEEILASYEMDISERTQATSGPALPENRVPNARLERLCANKLIIGRVLAHLTKLAIEADLTRIEVPRRLLLLAEDWTEDMNLVTAASKIKRAHIYKRYERELEQVYADNHTSSAGQST